MNIDAVRKAYRRYAEVYDFYFGRLFHPGRKAVVERMNCRPGDRILEVGVGTGLSLPLYPHYVQVTGIDISPEMLAKALARTRREKLQHVAGLEIMDAEHMTFADDSFDMVTAVYVASVVPDPALLVDEMRRVCKPDGELFIINHFQHSNPVVSGMERMISPLSKLMGFRPDFSLPVFAEQTRLEVTELCPVNFLGYWTLLRARNNKGLSRKPAKVPNQMACAIRAE